MPSRATCSALNNVEYLRYFTAPVSGKGSQATYIRQQTYLRALSTFPEISIHLGSFLTSTKTRQLVPPLADGTTHVKIVHTEEKGSDVNLATYLVHDAWRNLFDVALIYSQDTDLLEPLRIVKDELGRFVEVVVLDGRQPGKLAATGSYQHHLTPSRLAAAQLPDVLSVGRRGKTVQRPVEWL